MDIEDQLIKGTKLITNIKIKGLKPKINVRLSKMKYKKFKTNSIIKIKENIYVSNLFYKNRAFYRKVIVGYKIES